MNQAQALRVLRKIIGPKFSYRVDPNALDAEERERQREVFRQAAAASNAADAARRARYNEILAADAEYQALKAAAEKAKEAEAKAGVGLFHKRITVGRAGSLFFHVDADGDNWADVVEKVKAKRAA